MNIFITGGCGFIGSNFIIKQVQNHKNTVLNLDKLTYAGNPENLKAIAKDKHYLFTKGDITNKKLVTDLFASFKPDALVHFAAETHVDRSIEGPMKFIHTNIVGTSTLLEVASKYKKKFKFLHVSTDEVFGSLTDKEFFKETTPYNPSSPYSASKAGSDHLVRAWHRTLVYQC